jgi:hypothetical protein
MKNILIVFFEIFVIFSLVVGENNYLGELYGGII